MAHVVSSRRAPGNRAEGEQDEQPQWSPGPNWMPPGFILLTTSASSPISTGNILKTNEFHAQAGAPWTFLSHVGHKIQKDQDIQE
jgi:hypothetical protein